MIQHEEDPRRQPKTGRPHERHGDRALGARVPPDLVAIQRMAGNRAVLRLLGQVESAYPTLQRRVDTLSPAWPDEGKSGDLTQVSVPILQQEPGYEGAQGQGRVPGAGADCGARVVQLQSPGTRENAVTLKSGPDVGEGIFHVRNVGKCRIVVNGQSPGGAFGGPDDLLQLNPGQSATSYVPPAGSIRIVAGCFSDCEGPSAVEFDPCTYVA